MVQPDARELTLLQRLAPLELMIFDVDGVLTDGKLYYGPGGEVMKAFHALDGHGIKLLHSAGIATAILSARNSHIVTRRATELGIEEVVQGVDNKREALDDLLKRLGVPARLTGFMGDDVLDIPVMQRIGFAATVPHAANGVAAYAHWMSSRAGGHGAVREVCELILSAKGKLDALLAQYQD